VVIVRSQSAHAVLLVGLYPSPNATFSTPHAVGNLFDSHPTAIQAHRLQPLQFACPLPLLLLTPQLTDFCLAQLKLSFSQATILLYMHLFSSIH
jgi:hypothetical protein